MSDRTKPRKRPPRPTTPEELAKLCVAAAAQKKAQNIVVLEVGPLTGYADYFLLASGRSTRQARAIAENISRVLKKSGRQSIGEEGVRDGRWALLDFGDVVVHIFHQPVREFYDLEALWGDAPRVELDYDELNSILPPEADEHSAGIIWD